MHDLGQNWPAIPDFTGTLDTAGLRINSLANVRQYLVSGRLEAFAQATGAGITTTGALGLAKGSRYLLRLARDRMLMVDDPASARIADGWHDDGYAVSDISAALHIFEIEGPAIEDLLSEALLVDPGNAGASANVQFAGQTAILYRHDNEDRLRLHVERGLATYIWNWLERRA